jgi:hypothetical protein
MITTVSWRSVGAISLDTAIRLEGWWSGGGLAHQAEPWRPDRIGQHDRVDVVTNDIRLGKPERLVFTPGTWQRGTLPRIGFMRGRPGVPDSHIKPLVNGPARCLPIHNDDRGKTQEAARR